MMTASQLPATYSGKLIAHSHSQLSIAIATATAIAASAAATTAKDDNCDNNQKIQDCQ